MKRTKSPLKMTMQQRFQRELDLARSNVERLYEVALAEIHSSQARLQESTAIALHEAEQIVAALERVDGSFYQRIKDGMASYKAEQLKSAKEDAEAAMEKASK